MPEALAACRTWRFAVVRLGPGQVSLKLTGCYKGTQTYKMFNSEFLYRNFYIDDLRSCQFRDLPIISKWGKYTNAFNFKDMHAISLITSTMCYYKLLMVT